MGNQPSASRPTRRSAAGANGADPDGDGALDRQRGQAGCRDVVEASVDVTLSCVQSWRSTSICSSRKAPRVGERLTERLVLHAIPADAEPEPELPPAQDVELGRLLGQQGGLALGPDEDGGGEAEVR